MLKSLSTLFRKDGPGSGLGAPAAERRRSPRIVKQLPCDVHLRGRSVDVSRCEVRNFSVNAVSLEVCFPVRIGDELILSFEIFGTRVERAKAKVVWAVKSPKGFRCGVVFETG